MAKVGKPLIDIDVPEEVAEAVEANSGGPVGGADAAAESVMSEGLASTIPPPNASKQPEQKIESDTGKPLGNGKGTHATFATPAVRHASKELGIDISLITGTGKDGRVTKDDVYQYAKLRDSSSSTSAADSGAQTQIVASSSTASTARPAKDHGPQTETVQALTPVQSMMFKSMTASLRIPHFLYTDEVHISPLLALRKRLNKSLKYSKAEHGVEKVSLLPFIIKAMSLAIDKYPIINARVDAQEGQKPTLVMRKQHNIGVAMDTPSGLIVPVIKNVATLSILQIASELSRLQSLGKSGRLTTADLSGGTITLSNIGNIGGTYVSPVIVEKEVAILGIGKIREVPAFGEDGSVVRKEVLNFSWSADHRVVDGATMARAGECVRACVEEPGMMMVRMS